MRKSPTKNKTHLRTENKEYETPSSKHKIYNDPQIKNKDVRNATTQTDKYVFSDLTSTGPLPIPDRYWETLAERRGDKMYELYDENEGLKYQIDELKKENELLEDISSISENLAIVLQVSRSKINTC